MIQKDTKAKLIKAFGKSPNDVGSSEVQVALLSERIRLISTHLQAAKKDFHSQRGLLCLIGKRRALLEYLRKNQEQNYQKTLASLKQYGYM